ncbi:KOW domain-containing RNA-binding protein [Mediterraneibacter sp. NSJ-55]|uniref:KOW domain-containing RNA-binding protein n=1 Tax=Mediterraneibacter hominis TaxID=2763054 RepID=A0A923LIC1_9FIRM|nr:KOW domain-containing RNA-binding protein [Mediterraneibacter hominis]MBC5688804.1 KOW domain-containing RNA-binding protein [Mediterraneibacter hominis]
MVLKPGMLVKSKAGHDKNCIYVIIRVNDEYVYLSDGRKNTSGKLKRKNRKHLQVILKEYVEDTADEVAVRNMILKYSLRRSGNTKML